MSMSRPIHPVGTITLSIVLLTALCARTEASGRALCPGSVGIESKKGEAVILTKSNDMGGAVMSAEGATSCTIRFYRRHKTPPYCSIYGIEDYHVEARVLRTTSTEVTFSFNSPLPKGDGGGFTYDCKFRD
jgi:hypothetical protein